MAPCSKFRDETQGQSCLRLARHRAGWREARVQVTEVRAERLWSPHGRLKPWEDRKLTLAEFPNIFLWKGLSTQQELVESNRSETGAHDTWNVYLMILIRPLGRSHSKNDCLALSRPPFGVIQDRLDLFNPAEVVVGAGIPSLEANVRTSFQRPGSLCEGPVAQRRSASSLGSASEPSEDRTRKWGLGVLPPQCWFHFNTGGGGEVSPHTQG